MVSDIAYSRSLIFNHPFEDPSFHSPRLNCNLERVPWFPGSRENYTVDNTLNVSWISQGLEGEALSLKESVFLSAPHHSTMHGLHLQKPAFGLTVRAVTRWLEEHMMSGHLR